MELLLILLALGAGLYVLFKRNTQRGANTVRAYIYLRLVRDGTTPESANTTAATTDVAGLPTEIIREAMQHVRDHYGGKQLPFLAEAMREGYAPRLP